MINLVPNEIFYELKNIVVYNCVGLDTQTNVG